MGVPVFDDSLRTGNESIDSQHEWLFALSDRVAKKIRLCAPGTRDARPDDATCRVRDEDAVAEAVYGLIDYITEHLGEEEQLMISASYPKARLHKALHEDLSKRVGEYTLRFVNGDQMAALELTEFFDEWLSSHIMVHDREFSRWLSESDNR
jgi:hemerythrin